MRAYRICAGLYSKVPPAGDLFPMLDDVDTDTDLDLVDDDFIFQQTIASVGAA